jgi:hypothetical protein
LALLTGIKVVAEALSGAFNFEELPALRNGTGASVARLKEPMSEDAIGVAKETCRQRGEYYSAAHS